MKRKPLYAERVSSKKTALLFLGLTTLFLLLLIWRTLTTGVDILAVVFLCFFGFFLFYWLNYQTLKITLNVESLKLTFGIFSWIVPLDNIEKCGLDDLPSMMRMGGAGIHFIFVQKRYRASFNFLEFPRVVIAFKNKVGPVRDISFTTRHPDKVLRLLQEAVSRKYDAPFGDPFDPHTENNNA